MPRFALMAGVLGVAACGELVSPEAPAGGADAAAPEDGASTADGAAPSDASLPTCTSLAPFVLCDDFDGPAIAPSWMQDAGQGTLALAPTAGGRSGLLRARLPGAQTKNPVVVRRELDTSLFGSGRAIEIGVDFALVAADLSYFTFALVELNAGSWARRFGLAAYDRGQRLWQPQKQDPGANAPFVDARFHHLRVRIVTAPSIQGTTWLDGTQLYTDAPPNGDSVGEFALTLGVTDIAQNDPTPGDVEVLVDQVVVRLDPP